MRDDDKIAPNLRALTIIEVLAKAGKPLTPTEINEHLQLPKPTIHRLCTTLLQQGFLTRDVDVKRLRPARRLRLISAGIMTSSRIHIARHAILRDVSEAIGETCNLSVPEENGMVYVDRVETHWPMRFQLPVGSSVPFHCTASGKLFLSTLEDVQLDKLLSTLKLEQFARNTIENVDDLKRELEATRKRGFSRDNEEFIDNLIAVSVPIIDQNQALFAALAFHAPKQRITLEQAEEHVVTLRNAADKLAAILFGEPD
ncbi:MAG: IclR family transcriptional regulator [Alphaproteobacteria bacterium]|nr:IclR family transcriptional regulator [Alphaproteobacteria bacterium]